jgi:hypothetical protein
MRHAGSLVGMQSAATFTGPAKPPRLGPGLYAFFQDGGGDDSAWSTIGRAGSLMDNLLAAKKVKPMIVVMPKGSIRRPGFSLRLIGADRDSPAAIAARIEAIPRLHDVFVQDVLKTIIPTVEERYRVLTARDYRCRSACWSHMWWRLRQIGCGSRRRLGCHGALSRAAGHYLLLSLPPWTVEADGGIKD